jgi:lipopolysaccharide biosynthesis protein
MKSTDYIYKGYKITILEHNKGFDVRIYKNDNFINGWNYLQTFIYAGSLAQEYIDNLQGEQDAM